MYKRMLITAILLVCIASIAGADGMFLSTDILPSCYQVPQYGPNLVYADAPVPVYASQSMNDPASGYVYPNQLVQVETVDNAAGLVFIYYNDGRQQNAMIIDAQSSSGWIESRYVTYYTDTARIYVVTTDKPGNRLNLRTKPTADSVSLGKYYAGTIMQQLEEPRNGYMMVQIANVVGYMDTRFLAQGMYTPTADMPLLTVTWPEGIYLHRLSLPDSETIQYVPYGAVVTAISVRDDEMIQVMYNNEIGYIHYSLVDPKLTY